MQKVFASRLKDTTFSFFEDDVNHLKNVMRMQINDELVCIYEQKKYLTKIVSLNPLLAEIVSELQENNELKDVELTLCQAIIKPKHFEWILSKSTELQVNQIIPILFERSQKSNSINPTRMQTIVLTAAKQSSRNKAPTILPDIKSKKMFENLNDFDLVIVPFETRQDTNLGEVLNNLDFYVKKVAILVGPEGGFSNSEVEILQTKKNVKFVSLSKTILRSETASFYTLSVVVDWLIRKEH